jgi:hypothetical protein
LRPSLVRSQSIGREPIPPDWRSFLARFPHDVREAWEERAAIIQYDGGEPRPTAERRAFECIVSDYVEARAILREYCCQSNVIKVVSG